jgi:hypothetical protein
MEAVLRCHMAERALHQENVVEATQALRERYAPLLLHPVSSLKSRHSNTISRLDCGSHFTCTCPSVLSFLPSSLPSPSLPPSMCVRVCARARARGRARVCACVCTLPLRCLHRNPMACWGGMEQRGAVLRAGKLCPHPEEPAAGVGTT